MAWHVQVKNGGVESGKVEAHLIVSDEGANQHWPANTSSAHWNASAGHVVDTTAVTHDTVKMEFEPLIVNGSDASHSVLTIGPLDFYTAADSEAYYSVAVTGYSIFDGSSSTAHQWRGSVQQRPCLKTDKAPVCMGGGAAVGAFELTPVDTGTGIHDAVINASGRTLLIPLDVKQGGIEFRRLVVDIALVGRFERGHHSGPSGTVPFRFDSMIRAPGVTLDSNVGSTPTAAGGLEEQGAHAKLVSELAVLKAGLEAMTQRFVAVEARLKQASLDSDDESAAI